MSDTTCDFCGEDKGEIQFGGITRQFCSVQCVNGYLAAEGFGHRMCELCHENVFDRKTVCEKCRELPKPECHVDP